MDTAPLALVEEELVRQKSAMSRLHTQKNTFSLILRLPNETLADIFIHCARDYYYRDKNQNCRLLPSWLNVSYVCRRWRDIALGCATLWTYLSIMSPRWIEELLERSKQASLKIQNDMLDSLDVLRFLNMTKKTMVHVARIQEFQLSFRSRYADEVFAILSSRAPRLQNLKISMPHEMSSSLVLFDGDTPSLRTLELENIRMPFFLLNARGLRTLHLRGAPGPFRKDMKDFLSTLGYMDSLTHLCLDNAFLHCREFISSPAFNACPKIRLPHLSQLLISGPISTVTVLLSSLDFPLTAEVRLATHSELRSSHEDYALFSSILAQKYTSIMSADRELFIPAIRSLVIEFTVGRRRLTCSASELGRDFDYPPYEHLGWDCNAPLQISLPNSWSDTEHIIISDICHFLPLTHLQNVHVIDSPDSLDFWKRAFGHLQELRYIKLSGGQMPNLASILAESHRGFMENHADQIFAPALEVLELHDITFPVRSDEGRFGPDLPSLRDALATREERRVELVLIDCYEDSEDGSETEDGDDDICHRCDHNCCR